MGLVDDIDKLIKGVESALPEVTQLVATVSGKPVATMTPTAPVAVSVSQPISTGISKNTLKNIGLTLLAIGAAFFGWKALQHHGESKGEGKTKEGE